MRITYIHQYFRTPTEGGATRSYEMARRLVEDGHVVQVIAARNGSGTVPRWDVKLVDGITVHYVAVEYSNSMSISRRALAFAAFSILATIRAVRLRSDLVFATSTPLTVAIPAIVAKRMRRIPMVFEVRDLWPDVPIAMGALRQPFMQWAARVMEKAAYTEASAVIALSEGMAKGVRRRGISPASIHVIPNGSDVELYDVSPSEGAAIRQRYPWLRDLPLVLYAGTFGRVNGVDYMVRLAAAVGTLDSEVRFLALGSGSERDRVSSLAASLGVLGRSFFILDSVSKVELAKFLNACTVATSWVVPIPALYENSASKFFDGLAASRPVVINHPGWQADLLVASGAGLSLKGPSIEEDAQNLVAFLRDEQGMNRARAAASLLANERFDRSRLYRQFVDVLEGAIRD